MFRPKSGGFEETVWAHYPNYTRHIPSASSCPQIVIFLCATRTEPSRNFHANLCCRSGQISAMFSRLRARRISNAEQLPGF